MQDLCKNLPVIIHSDATLIGQEFLCIADIAESQWEQASMPKMEETLMYSKNSVVSDFLKSIQINCFKCLPGKK